MRIGVIVQYYVTYTQQCCDIIFNDSCSCLALIVVKENKNDISKHKQDLMYMFHNSLLGHSY